MTLSKDYTDKQFWDAYYHGYQLKEVGRVFFADLFDRYLNPDQDKTVFEVGCAGGYTLCYLAKHFKFKAFGIDYSDKIEMTRALFAYNNLPEPVLYKEDLFAWTPPRQYDVVCSFGFIEHFDDPRRIIETHLKLVAPGGTLIITMPHFAHLQYFFHWLIDRENLKKHNTKVMNLKVIKKALLDCHPEPGRRVEIQYLNYFRTFGFWTERTHFKWWERILYVSIQFSGRIINKLLGPNHPNPLVSPHLVLIAKKNH